LLLGADIKPDRHSRQTGLSTLEADFTKVPSFEAPDAPQSNEERERPRNGLVADHPVA